MEFGFFEDLSETDQAYIREILACKTTCCKEGKKPQFAWINDVDSVDTFDQQEGATCVEVKEPGHCLAEPKVPHDRSSIHHEVPTQMMHVPVSVVSGMVPQPTYTMGFGMTQAFINYAPGVPILAQPYGMAHAPGMVFMPQVNYMPGVPVSLSNEQQAVPAQPEVTLTQEVSGGNERRENDETFDIIPQKPTERRNRKRRPPDYYERLATCSETDPIRDNKEDETMATKETSSVGTSSADMHISTNIDKERTSSIEQALSSDVPAQSNIHSQPVSSNVAEEGQIDGSYAEPQTNSAKVSHHKHNTSPPPDSSIVETDAVQPPGSVQYPGVPAESDSRTLNFSAGDQSQQPPLETIYNRSKPSSCTTDPDSTQLSSQPVVHEPEEGFPPLSESVVTKKSTSSGVNGALPQSENSTDVSKSDTESMHETNAGYTVDKELQSEGHTDSVTDESVSDQEAASKAATANIEQETGAAVPKKPNTWAGLFSGTKEAKNATVIYTVKEKEKDKDVEKTVAEKKPEETIPVVVATSEDSMARDIADVLLNHRLNHKAISLQPRGLRNRRNWCYISATLQALLACPPFYHLMKALPKRENGTSSSTPVLDCLYRFVGEFSYLPHRSIEQNKVLNAKGTMKLDIPQGATFEPAYVYDVLKTPKYSSAFLDGRQEDAEEFFSSFINGLHDEMVACSKLFSTEERETEGPVNGVIGHEQKSGDVEEEEDGWEQVGPKNKAVVTRTTSSPISPISALFQGQIRSILHQTGARESAMLQPFFTLQLDIQSDKVITVKDALEGYVRKESLQDYTCSKTKQEVEATRRLTLEELPPVLVLHLKYFLYDKSGGCQKLNKNIEYSVDLEISRDLLSPNMKSKVSASQRKYKLFGVVNHHGHRAVGGHYTTYVYHPGINGWIHIDDEIVRSVTIGQVLKHNPPKVPYLLYYRRIDHVQ